MSLLLSVTNKQNTVKNSLKFNTTKEKDVQMSIKAAFPLFLMGKLCLIYAPIFKNATTA
jgi:hypothetical protein